MANYPCLSYIHSHYILMYEKREEYLISVVHWYMLNNNFLVQLVAEPGVGQRGLSPLQKPLSPLQDENDLALKWKSILIFSLKTGARGGSAPSRNFFWLRHQVQHKHKVRNFIVFNIFIFILKADEYFSYENDNGRVFINYVKENIVLEVKLSTDVETFKVKIKVKRYDKKII